MWEPKNGDIVIDDLGVIAIYKSTNADGGIITYAGYWHENGNLTTSINTGWGRTKDFRPATEEEKQRFFDVLAKKGYRWNAKNKCIEDLPRWRQLPNENYYLISSTLTVDCQPEIGYSVDNERYSIGNYFKTREAAERVAKEIRGIFKNSKSE